MSRASTRELRGTSLSNEASLTVVEPGSPTAGDAGIRIFPRRNPGAVTTALASD
jgi:hypothetical protein